MIGVSDILCDRIIFPKYVEAREKIITVLDILNEAMICRMAIESNLSFSGFNIVTVGRLVPLKEYDLAIMAAKQLKDKGIKFKWYFVGGGMREELEALARAENVADCIMFEGEQLNPYPYIAQCDIYVQTSKFEGFGLTIGEAKILGRPIVSTNFPVVYNQITPEENGLVVEMIGNATADFVQKQLSVKQK